MPEGSNMGAPSAADIQAMLADISMNSGAEVGFERMTFTINGSDDAVKVALKVIQDIPFVNRCASQIRVKIELANEQKEFVAGKKNGKINKIMGMSTDTFRALLSWRLTVGRHGPNHIRWFQ